MAKITQYLQEHFNEPVEPFYISATSSILERRPRILKQHNTFAVIDHYGDIVGGQGSIEGLYHEDTRFLSSFQMRIGGRRPLLLSSNVQGNNVMLSVDLTNPDFKDGDTVTLPRDVLHIIRSKFLWDAACYERIGVQNFDILRHTINLSLWFYGDFADLFEVRGHQRPKRGEQHIQVNSDRSVAIIYKGLDNVTRITSLTFDPLPDTLDDKSAIFHLDLQPQRHFAVFVTIRCTESQGRRPERQQFSTALKDSRYDLQKHTSRFASIDTSNAIFNELMRRSLEDLGMLITDTDDGPFPYAGIPWFSAPFGRDSMITAMQVMWANPTLAVGVLHFLAQRQATETNPAIDATPGKILHEMRFGEMANLKEVPFGLYYGSVDSTPLFIMLAGMYYDRTGDLAVISQLWPHIEAGLRWLDQYGDADGDGFIEYGAGKDGRLANQGWKDSHDSIFHADGSLARGPIALCEVQGYAYAARLHAAHMAAALGDHEEAAALKKKAETLKEQFLRTFWLDDIGAFALALDGNKNPCRVRSSNAGQLLWTGIVDPYHAEIICRQLTGEDFFTGWGIRTIGCSESRYNPMSYHNGSVWPHDNALIARGFAKYGFMRECQKVFAGIFDAAIYMEQRRLPELFCGFNRRPGRRPTLYPVACIPQAWASATPFCLLEACLGISFNPSLEEIRFHQPHLPEFLDEIILRNLRVGNTQMDIVMRRVGHDVSVNLLSKTGHGRANVTF